MKTKLFFGFIVLVIAAISINMKLDSTYKNLSILTLANVEALSQTEDDGWERGYKTVVIYIDGDTRYCCGPGYPTDACNYAETICIQRQ
jgi:hypothetical protein